MDLDGDVRHRTISFSLAFCTDSNQEHSNLLSTPTCTPTLPGSCREAICGNRTQCLKGEHSHNSTKHEGTMLPTGPSRPLPSDASTMASFGFFWYPINFSYHWAPAPPFPNLCLTLLAYTKVLDPSLFYLHMLCRKYCIPHVPLDLPNNAKICQSTIISDFNPAISSLGPMVLRR